jgi:hypothetical protein
MAIKHTPLTQAQFDQLALVDWTINEIPREIWPKIPGLQRLQDTFSVMGSGSVVNPGILNGINAVAGIDVLAYERNPMGGEPEGNAYHYVIQKISDPRYPYVLHGPFKSETIVDHWFDAPQLDRYWSDLNNPLERDNDSGQSRKSG